MGEPPDKKPTHKTIKTSLKSVAKNDQVIAKLLPVVSMSHKIVVHTLLLMKLYFIHLYDTNQTIPKIDRAYVKCFMKVLCETPKRGRKPTQATVDCKEEISKFYQEHYAHLMSDTLNYTHMNTLIDYVADGIVTIYENNIEQRFVSYVELFVNVCWEKKELVRIINSSIKTKIDKKQLVNKLCGNLRKIKNDLITDDIRTSSPIYHKWIDTMKSNIMPNRSLQKGTVYYDVKCSPQDYLKGMIYMMRVVEQKGITMCSVFPLRREATPKYVPIDTATLIHILFTKNEGKKEFYLTKGNLKIYQEQLWNMFFKLNKKTFRSDKTLPYQFAFMIETDGVGCSILTVRKDLVEKRMIREKKGKANESYITEANKSVSKKNIVAIDPNKGDLIFCIDDEENMFRYTQDQRRKETKQKVYRDIVKEKKKTKIDGKTVVEWETELSFHNSRTLNFKLFQEYIKKKNEVNNKIIPFYEDRIFRKLRLGSFMLRQKTEDRMLNRFEKMYGKVKETIVCFGDFEQKQHMKYKAPVKGKGFRNLFRKRGYDVYLVDEFRTSCRCSYCGGECNTFRHCPNPRPWKDNIIMRHGLLKCETCNRLWNRDVNASLNIHKISKAAVSGEDRPLYLQRKQNVSVSGTTSVSHP
jgi:hypothetical protein